MFKVQKSITKSLLFIVDIVILLSIIGCAASSKKPNQSTSSDQSKVETTTQPTISLDNTDESHDENLNNSISNPAIQLETLVRDYEETFLNTSGWLHFSYTHNSDYETGIGFPDDSIAPSNFHWDGWFNLNEEGEVLESIITYETESGKAFLIEANTGKVKATWPWNERFENVEPDSFYLDLGISSFMLESYENELPFNLSVEKDEIRGQSVFRFINEQRYQDLHYIGDSSQPVQCVRTIALLDADTGALVDLQTIFILENGNEEVSRHISNLLTKWDELPEEKAEFLEGVKNGTYPEANQTTGLHPAPHDVVLDRLLLFNERCSRKFTDPGWVLVKEYKAYFVEDINNEENISVPSIIYVDSYYLMGENGEVQQYVSVSDTDEVITYSNGVYTNLTYPEKSLTQSEIFYMSKWDYGLQESLMKNPNLELDMSDQFRGRAMITATEMYTEDATIGENTSIVGFVSSYDFNIADGCSRSIVNSYVLPDGSLLMQSQFVLEDIRKVVAPPDFILVYLEE